MFDPKGIALFGGVGEMKVNLNMTRGLIVQMTDKYHSKQSNIKQLKYFQS